MKYSGNNMRQQVLVLVLVFFQYCILSATDAFMISPTRSGLSTRQLIVCTATRLASKDLHNKVNGIDQKLEDLKKEIATLKLKSTKGEGSSQNLKNEIVSLRSTIKEEGKRSRIQNAIQLVDERRSFNVYENSGGGVLNSSEIIKDILFSFVQGRGHYIDEYTTTRGDFDKEGGKKEFRDHLKDELHQLTGTAPKFKKETGGRWAVDPG